MKAYPAVRPRLLVDCTPLAKGGGVQVALGLLHHLSTRDDIEWQALLTPRILSSVPPDLLALDQMIILRRERGIAGLVRIALELRHKALVFRPTVAFTVFGPPYARLGPRHVCGFARPHMLYCEQAREILKRRLTPLSYVKARLKHDVSRSLRIAMLKVADHLIVETEVVRRRTIDLLGFPSNRVHVVRNAVNPLLLEAPVTDSAPLDVMRVLVPSAYYGHKNLEVVPEVAASLARLRPGLRVRFHLTLDATEPPVVRILEHAARLGQADTVKAIGHRTLAELAIEYAAADAVMLPTLLECSTAVYPETFHFQRPLVTSDLDFARAACAEAALYCRPLEPDAWAQALLRLHDQPEERQRLVKAGTKRLGEAYPLPEHKVRDLVALLLELQE